MYPGRKIAITYKKSNIVIFPRRIHDSFSFEFTFGVGIRRSQVRRFGEQFAFLQDVRDYVIGS